MKVINFQLKKIKIFLISAEKLFKMSIGIKVYIR